MPLGVYLKKDRSVGLPLLAGTSQVTAGMRLAEQFDIGSTERFVVEATAKNLERPNARQLYH